MNEQLLCRFFARLFRGDMDYLDSFEAEINASVTALLSGKLDKATAFVVSKRQKLLRLKHYYEQIDAILFICRRKQSGCCHARSFGAS